MKTVTIKKNGIITNQVELQDSEVSGWLEKHENMGTFGHKDIYEKQPILISEAVYEDQPVLIQEEITEQQEVLDENGNSYDPQQFQTVVIQEAIYGTNSVLVQPAVYEMEQVQVGVDENDQPIFEEKIKLIDVLVSPQDYEVIIEDVTAQVEMREILLRKQAKGQAAREACLAVLDLVGGDNLEESKTLEQKLQMKTLFANAKSALNDFQPGYAKGFIMALEPDGVLLTQELKDLCLEILKDWSIPT